MIMETSTKAYLPQELAYVKAEWGQDLLQVHPYSCPGVTTNKQLPNPKWSL